MPVEEYPLGQPRSPAGDGRAVVVAPRVALWLLSTMISEAGAFQNGQLQMLYVFIFFNSKLRLETKALTHGLVHFSRSPNNF